MICIIGRGGQVSMAMEEVLTAQKTPYIVFGRSDLDMKNFENLREAISNDSLGITAIINCAAYTAVDKAELESEQSHCHFANASLPGYLMTIANELKIPLIHYSSDYVYSGMGEIPWVEIDPTAPSGYYAKSKLAGDRAIQEKGGQYLIFRTSWVYSHIGHNFVRTMLKLGQERPTIKVVQDQIGAPTYAVDLALKTLDCLKTYKSLTHGNQLVPSGIYHMCGTGSVSWFEFAKEIFKQAKEFDKNLIVENIIGISSLEYPTPVKRPLNSRLNQDKINKIFSVVMPTWQDSLQQCIKRIYENH